MHVTAKHAQHGGDVYGECVAVDECIAPTPQNGWFRATVCMRGVYTPCDARTIVLQGHAS